MAPQNQNVDPATEFADPDEALTIERNGARFNSWEQNVLSDFGMDAATFDMKVQRRHDAQEFFDDPHSSLWSNVFSMIILTCIVISTITLIVETMPQYDNDQSRSDLFIVESICIFFFTIEYIARISLAYNRCEFFLNMMNTIDLLAIAPFFVTLTLQYGFGKSTDELGSLGVLRLIRLVRVFRI